MSSKILTVLTFVFATASAFAQSGSSITEKMPDVDRGSARGEGSVRVSQPKQGRTLISVSPIYSTNESAGKNTDTDYESYWESKGQSKSMDVELKSGLSDTLAVGLDLSYREAVSWGKRTRSEYEGLESPRVFLQSRIPKESLAIVGLVSFTPNLFEKECNDISPTRAYKCNNYDGGQSLGLILGVETTGRTILGLTAAANLRDLRTQKNKYNGVDEPQSFNSGGNSLGLIGYGERSIGNNILGIGLTLAHTAPTTYSDGRSNSTGDFHDSVSGNVYGKLNFASNFEVLPEVGYSKTINNERNFGSGKWTIFYDNNFTFKIGAMIGI